MKNNWFLLFIFFFISINSFSQDTIIKYNGATIIAKVTEITQKEVKYKRVDLIDGPVYVENKSEVKLIIFYNGVKEYFGRSTLVNPKNNNSPTTDSINTNVASLNKIEERGKYLFYHQKLINERELNSILMNTNDTQLMMLVAKEKKTRNSKYLWLGMFPCVIASAVLIHNINYLTGPANVDKLNDAYVTLAITTIGVVLFPSIGANGNDKHRQIKKEAIKLYNQKY